MILQANYPDKPTIFRNQLTGRGVSVGEIIEYPRGIKFAHFSDPDGNSWALQEIPPGI